MIMEISEFKWLNDIYKGINFKMLPHGIIISGPSGIGKKILAKQISKDLLENKNNNSENNNLFNHPDFFILDKDKILLHHITYREDKWDDEKGQRNVNDFLSVTPSIAINKIALILNAQTMNKAAQNALLKSLEEPAPNTYIIITTDRPKSLYETIYSRCQVINIPNISQSTTDEWLIKNGISDINSNDFPSFSTPLSILNDIQNNEHHNFKNFINIISEYVENKIDLNLTIKNITSLEIDLVTKANYLIEFLKILLKSNLLSEDLSGLYKKYNSSKFNNLKISNLINELNNFRYEFFKVPQINETHVLNYFLSEVKSSIRI
jgi:DNA polymerase III delta prime subunit